VWGFQIAAADHHRAEYRPDGHHYDHTRDYKRARIRSLEHFSDFEQLIVELTLLVAQQRRTAAHETGGIDQQLRRLWHTTEMGSKI
jgi:hypothetical protein